MLWAFALPRWAAQILGLTGRGGQLPHSQQPRRTFTLKVFQYTVLKKFEACGFSPDFEKGI